MAELSEVMFIRMSPVAKARATKTAADRGVGHGHLVRAAVDYFVGLDPAKQARLLGTQQMLDLSERGEHAVKAS